MRKDGHEPLAAAPEFFEFIGRIADSSTDGDTVRLPPALVQPEAGDDVASTLADVAVGAPLNDWHLRCFRRGNAVGSNQV